MPHETNLKTSVPKLDNIIYNSSDGKFNKESQLSINLNSIIHSNSLKLINEMERFLKMLDEQIKELLETKEKQVQLFTVEAVDLFIDWDVHSFRILMENPNSTQNILRKLLLSLPLKISRITSIKNDNSDITYNNMSDALSQTDKFLNEKNIGGLR